MSFCWNQRLIRRSGDVDKDPSRHLGELTSLYLVCYRVCQLGNFSTVALFFDMMGKVLTAASTGGYGFAVMLFDTRRRLTQKDRHGTVTTIDVPVVSNLL